MITDHEDVDVTTPLLRQTPRDNANIQSYEVRRGRGLCGHITVEPALLLYLLYKAGFFPLQEQYIYWIISHNMNISLGSNTTLLCHVNRSDPNYIEQQKVQSATSIWMIYASICSTIPALISTVFIGGYSDQGGRKIGLISPNIGGILQLYFLLCIEIFHLPVWYVLIGGFIEGLSGGMGTFLMATFSYISDVTSHDQRSMRIIILEVVIGLSSTVSFIMSGYMIQVLGYIGTTLVIHMIVVLNLCVIYVLPETLSANEGASLFTLLHFKKSVSVYTKDDGLGRRAALLACVLMLFFIAPARLGTDSVQVLFMLNAPLCWNSAFIGYFKGLYYLATSIGNILLTKIAQPKCGDLMLIIVGCVSAVAHLLCWAFAQTYRMMIIVPFLGIFSALPIGMIRAFSSKLVFPHELGAMFSWIASLEQLGVLFGSPSFNIIYKATLMWFNGFVFIVIASLYLCAGLVAGALFMKKRQQEQRIMNDVNGTSKAQTYS